MSSSVIDVDLPGRIAAVSRRPSSLGTVPDGAVSLAMGEPFSDTPGVVIDQAIASLHAGRTRYAPLTGTVGLRSALADRLTQRHGRTFSPSQVVPTHGASAGLAATMLALVRPGDRVVVPEPTYSLYADHVAMAGGIVEWVAPLPDGSLDVERIAELVLGARMLVLCNPANPTGAVLDGSQMGAVSAAVARSGCYLVSDEAYADIVFDGLVHASALDLPDLQDQVVCCGTFSKSYAMTGWRIGHVVAAESVADAIGLVHRTFNGALNTVVQDSAVAALSLPDTMLHDVRDAYQERRDLVMSMLSGRPGVHLAVPQGAFYAFPRLDTALSSDALTERFAEGGVLVRSGREYGPSGEGHVRISFATDVDTLAEGLRRVVDVVEQVTAS